MVDLGSRRDRNRKFSMLGGRTLAVVVITAVAAVSFSLGYKAGSSGMEGQGVKGQVQVVPEGAGLVLLGGQGACEEKTSGDKDTSVASSVSTSAPGAVLETIKSAAVPQPDPVADSMGPDEPVLEPVGGKMAAVSTPAKPKEAERRVAPIRQLPAAEDNVPHTETPAREESLKDIAAPVARSKPVPENRSVTASKRPAPVKKTAASKPVASSSDSVAYSVQIGAFSSLNDARTHRIRFTNKGYKASVYKDKGADGSDIYKVRVGSFTAKAEAEKMALRLKSAEGVNGFVTAIE